MNQNQKRPRCQHVYDEGYQCNNPVWSGSEKFCYAHDPFTKKDSK